VLGTGTQEFQEFALNFYVELKLFEQTSTSCSSRHHLKDPASSRSMPTQGPEPGNDTLFEASYRLGMLSDAPHRSIQNEHRLDLTTFLICS
jgi:hypothetical protein